MFSISKNKNYKVMKDSSMSFHFSESQLDFEELGSSFFLLLEKIHEEAKYMSKLVTCFVLKMVFLYLCMAFLNSPLPNPLV